MLVLMRLEKRVVDEAELAH